MKAIDLRSDTVTQPTIEMRAAMTTAEVGDDVYGDDPTVNELERVAATMLGFEAAVFTPSGTQANLIGILAHCDRGDEYIVGQQAHTYRYEAGGAAVFGSVQPQPVEMEEDGSLCLAKVEEKIKPDDFHFARTKLLCLENTQNGRALSMGYLREAGIFARRHNLRLHLDGARLANAAVAQNVSLQEITRPFDSATLCLSKGLGAPAGSLLCGSAEYIREARKWRKMAGGGMRQAGILAAGGLFALENNIERLTEDHANAKRLAQGLEELKNEQFNVGKAHTNMVFCTINKKVAEEFFSFLQKRNILITPGVKLRLVTHLGIKQNDVDRFVEAAKEFFHASSFSSSSAQRA